MAGTKKWGGRGLFSPGVEGRSRQVWLLCRPHPQSTVHWGAQTSGPVAVARGARGWRSLAGETLRPGSSG